MFHVKNKVSCFILLDRFDPHVELPLVDFRKLSSNTNTRIGEATRVNHPERGNTHSVYCVHSVVKKSSDHRSTNHSSSSPTCSPTGTTSAGWR